MQIKMIGTFSYDLVPGVSRRTLHAGLVLDEPVDVAQAAIADGKAVRWPPEAGAVTGEGEGDDPAPSPRPAPQPKPATKQAAGSKKGARSETPSAPPTAPASEPTPAEPVEPGGSD
jgi:hypothetical protein